VPVIHPSPAAITSPPGFGTQAEAAPLAYRSLSAWSCPILHPTTQGIGHK
jgi:hypothetical protein